jgi:uncharacterized protein YndB with AHSA1/START domain
VPESDHGRTTSGLLLQLKCAIDAPCERIFSMLTEPVELVKWWGPHGFTTPETELDLRVGGGYRFCMKPPEGDVFSLSQGSFATEERLALHQGGWTDGFEKLRGLAESDS